MRLTSLTQAQEVYFRAILRAEALRLTLEAWRLSKPALYALGELLEEVRRAFVRWAFRRIELLGEDLTEHEARQLLRRVQGKGAASRSSRPKRQ